MRRKLKWVRFGIAVLILFSASSIRADNNVNIFVGERKNVWIEINDRDGAAFTLQTATYWVKFSNVEIAPQTSATIAGTRIYGLVNATGWEQDELYNMLFRWHVAGSPGESYITSINLITYYGGQPTPTPSPTPSPTPAP